MAWNDKKLEAVARQVCRRPWRRAVRSEIPASRRQDLLEERHAGRALCRRADLPDRALHAARRRQSRFRRPAGGDGRRADGPRRHQPSGLALRAARAAHDRADRAVQPCARHARRVFDLRVADIGDVPFASRYRLEQSHDDIERRFNQIVGAGVVPLSVGGDHSITHPILKAVGKNRPVGMIHIDAHCDTGGAFDQTKFHHGGPFRNAVLDGVLDPTRTIQIGIRGSAEYLWEFSYESGMTVIHAEEVTGHGHQGDHRKGAEDRRRWPDLSVLRCRQPRPGLRAGHRHAGSRRADHARGAGNPARPEGPRTWSAATSSRWRRNTTRRPIPRMPAPRCCSRY